MSSPVIKIKKLVKYLPQRDIKVAERLIDNRDFEGLKELIISVDYLMDKNKDNNKSIYYGLDSEKITNLFSIVNDYCILLDPVDEDSEYEDNSFTNYEFEDNI